MQTPPDDIAWLPESRLLDLCGLSRSTFQSWQRAGLDVGNDQGAYSLDDAIALIVLAAVRDHLAPKDMVGAWRFLLKSGEAADLLAAARLLKRGDRFDLVIEPDLASLKVARSDAELADAVRHPTDPRPVVVLDLAERVYRGCRAFERLGNESPKPRRKAPGRPRSADRKVHVLRRAEGA